MDLGTIIGLVVAFGGILLSIMVEGGSLRSLVNVSAALIVFGGTYGATIACSDLRTFLRSPSNALAAVLGKTPDRAGLATDIADIAARARKQGLLALEPELANIANPILRKALQLVIDGLDPEMVREVLRNELRAREAQARRDAAFFSTWGGFGPTLGVTGTVMGLINMMGELENPSDMGPAIASAFTATLYGVATANLVFLPISKKLLGIAEQERVAGEMIIEGVCAIQEGATPLSVQLRLEAYLPDGKAKPAKPDTSGDLKLAA
jgi:chemotaxis protein MotA